MSILTTVTRMWLTRSTKPFLFRNEYDSRLPFDDCDKLGLYVHIPFCKKICNFCPYCKTLYSKELCDKYLDALLKEPFLLREDNSGTKQETLYFLKNKGLSLDDLNVIAVMDDAAALKQCIMLGMGISILSKATIQADARQGKLLLFPLGEAAFLRKLYLVYSPVKYMAEEGGVFLEFAKRFYQL